MKPLYFVLVGGRALVFADHYDTLETAISAVADLKRLFGRVELRDKSPFDAYLGDPISPGPLKPRKAG